MRYRRLLTIITVLLSMALLVSCKRQSEPSKTTTVVTTEEVRKETGKDGTKTTVMYTQKEEKEVYEKQMEDKITEYDKKIDKLKSKAEKVGGEVKAEYDLNIEQLQHKKNVAIEKLHELKYASGKTWEDIKSGVEAVMADFETQYNRLVARFD